MEPMTNPEYEPKPNPYLSAAVYGLTHFNPAQTDTIPYPVKHGIFHVNLNKQARIDGGPINIMTLAATQPGYMWAISTDRVAYIDCAQGKWRIAAELDLPGVRRIGSKDLRDLLEPQYTSIEQVEKLATRILGHQPQNITMNGPWPIEKTRCM